jgi:hypothetical protein
MVRLIVLLSFLPICASVAEEGTHAALPKLREAAFQADKPDRLTQICLDIAALKSADGRAALLAAR